MKLIIVSFEKQAQQKMFARVYRLNQIRPACRIFTNKADLLVDCIYQILYCFEFKNNNVETLMIMTIFIDFKIVNHECVILLANPMKTKFWLHECLSDSDNRHVSHSHTGEHVRIFSTFDWHFLAHLQWQRSKASHVKSSNSDVDRIHYLMSHEQNNCWRFW